MPPLGSPDRVARHMSSWGVRIELLRIAMRATCHQGEGSLHRLYTFSVQGALQTFENDYSEIGEVEIDGPIKHLMLSTFRNPRNLILKT